jgi:hypothetical protein
VLNIKDRAEAARVYGIQAHDDELINNAVEIKMRAKSRAGEMLIEGKKAGQIATKGQPEKKCDKPATLSQVGLTRKESAQYQQLAAVPEPELEKAIEVVKKRDGVLTEAAVKREILPSKAERERDARIAELKKQQGNNIIPPHRNHFFARSLSIFSRLASCLGVNVTSICSLLLFLPTLTIVLACMAILMCFRFVVAIGAF